MNQQLRDILEMADFVKFAKMRPLPDDNEQVMRYAENFVEETKPEEKAPRTTGCRRYGSRETGINPLLNKGSCGFLNRFFEKWYLRILYICCCCC